MAEETTDKSIVVWHPSLLAYGVPDTRELTSLCLFHDKVVMCLFCVPLNIRHDLIFNYCYTSQDSKERVAFIAKIHFLTKHNIIEQITPKEVTQVAHKVSEKPIAHRLSKRLQKLAESSLTEAKLKEDIIFEASHITDSVASCVVSEAYRYPLVTNDIDLQDRPNIQSTKTLSEVLAQSAICQLALSDVKAVHAEDILEARTELKDELLEFRAGILKLTWLLHQKIQNSSDLEEMRHEADVLTNTVIKGSLLSLENRMRQHKNKRIRRMLFGTGKVLVEATKLFLPGGATEKMIAGGKSLFQLATELDSAKPPEDQVATYLYRLRGKFNYE